MAVPEDEPVYEEPETAPAPVIPRTEPRRATPAPAPRRKLPGWVIPVAVAAGVIGLIILISSLSLQGMHTSRIVSERGLQILYPGISH